MKDGKLFRNTLFLFFLMCAFFCYGQESEEDFASADSVEKEKNWYLRGYIKDLQSVTFINSPDGIITNNLIHNRLNFKYLPTSSFTGVVEVRNRLFYGEQVKLTPGFAQSIEYNQNLVDLSWDVINERSAVFHVMIDRAYLNWTRKKLEVKVGRQRINWGKTLAWNPNDIFNTYSFFDFDYEERPGVDAVNIQYYTGDISNAEIAVAPGTSIDKSVAGFKYNLNKWNYDLQVIGGLYYTDLVIGGGWAGNIRNGGFKGEVSYFHPRNNFSDTTGAVTFTTQVDHSIGNGWYVNGSFLYNSVAARRLNIFSLSQSTFSAKSLLPFKYSFLVNTAKQISPLTSANVSVIYSPNSNALIFFPSIAYSITESWDMDFVAQSFFADVQNSYRSLGTSVFLRIRKSF